MASVNSRFGLAGVTCPHCGRPFVDALAACDHVKECRDAAQQKLDAKWAEQNYKESQN